MLETVTGRRGKGHHSRADKAGRSESEMTTSSTRMPRVVTHGDLELHGFSPEQIGRLDELKAVYPYLEFTDSIEEWRRLTFLKWRHSTGRVSE